MLVPVVGNAAREADHLAKDGDLAVQRAPFAVRQLHGARRQAFDELIAAFGDDLDGVGRQQLIVAQRRRDRARPLIVFKPRLHVVIAVAAGLEAVDTHDLLFGQPGRQGDAGVSAFEFALALRLKWSKLELALGGCEKVGHHRHVRRGRRRLFLRLRRIARFRRAAIDRRLRQHIIVERDLFTARAFRRPQMPLCGNRAPIRLGRGRVARLDLQIFGQSAAILDHRGRKRRRRHCRCGWRVAALGRLGAKRRRRQSHRCREQTPEATS